MAFGMFFAEPKNRGIIILRISFGLESNEKITA